MSLKPACEKSNHVFMFNIDMGYVDHSTLKAQVSTDLNRAFLIFNLKTLLLAKPLQNILKHN